MITVKSVVRVASFEFENSVFKGTGEARIDEQSAIKQINGTLYKNGSYAGSFSSQMMTEGETEPKFNINGVASEDLAQVAELVNSISADLKAEFVK